MPMKDSSLPEALVSGLLALCRGDFSYRMPRTLRTDPEDTVAFFVNAIAEELERVFKTSQEQQARLTRTIEEMSRALTRVASGDFTVQVPRDFSGDSPDVLAYLVNNTIVELARYVEASQRRSLEDRRQLEQLVEERTRELKQLATTDALTGTLNRRRFFEIAEEERARSERYGRSLSVAMLDLDHFKVVNDTYGHSVGDQALERAAAVVKRVVRRQDCVGRYGGEEFGLVLPETELAEARQVCERIRVEIRRIDFRANDELVPLRVSAGVAQWRKEESIDAALRRADAALYQAKDGGRDRVVAAP